MYEDSPTFSVTSLRFSTVRELAELRALKLEDSKKLQQFLRDVYEVCPSLT